MGGFGTGSRAKTRAHTEDTEVTEEKTTKENRRKGTGPAPLPILRDLRLFPP
jgi:hypothetical protein